MPTSATGTSDPRAGPGRVASGSPARSPVPVRPDGGWTLVELLVVVFVIGLMSGLVVMSLPPGTPLAEREADRLARILDRTAKEAIVAGEPLAWRLDGGAYRLERYRDGDWQPADLARPPAPVPASLRVRVALDGAVAADAGGDGGGRGLAAARDAEAVLARRIIFLPYGEATPADILLQGTGSEATVRVTADGDVQRVAGDG